MIAHIFLLRHHTPKVTLFPYTTLFRSWGEERHGAVDLACLAQHLEGCAVVRAGEDRHHPKIRPSSYIWVMAILSDRKSTRLNSSHITISDAVFCLKKKKGNRVSNDFAL